MRFETGQVFVQRKSNYLIYNYKYISNQRKIFKPNVESKKFFEKNKIKQH